MPKDLHVHIGWGLGVYLTAGSMSSSSLTYVSLLFPMLLFLSLCTQKKQSKYTCNWYSKRNYMKEQRDDGNSMVATAGTKVWCGGGGMATSGVCDHTILGISFVVTWLDSRPTKTRQITLASCKMSFWGLFFAFSCRSLEIMEHADKNELASPCCHSCCLFCSFCIVIV